MNENWLFLQSLPVRECGLKYHMEKESFLSEKSLPVRECGLKSGVRILCERGDIVTPRAEVWVEMWKC